MMFPPFVRKSLSEPSIHLFFVEHLLNLRCFQPTGIWDGSVAWRLSCSESQNGGGALIVIEGLQIDVTCGLRRPGRCSKPIKCFMKRPPNLQWYCKRIGQIYHRLNSPFSCNDRFWILAGLCWRVASFAVPLMDDPGGRFFLWHYWLPMCARSRPISFSHVCIKQMLHGISRCRVVCHQDGKLIRALLVRFSL